MTTEELNKSTKEKIVEVATELFAKNGFAGTSVREIAKAADVNLAAINYHFKNKENLYWKVFEHNHCIINDAIVGLGDDHTTEELTIKVFHLFIKRDTEIMNTFKMFLSDNIGVSEQELIDLDVGEMGPPGKDNFATAVMNDVKAELPIDSIKWAVKSIFSLVVHIGVIMGTSYIKNKKDDEFSTENMEKMLRHSVRAHLKYLEENPKLK